MSYEFILVETKGRVALITLNRPKQLNPLNPKLMQELGAGQRAGAFLLTHECVPA